MKIDLYQILWSRLMLWHHISFWWCIITISIYRLLICYLWHHIIFRVFHIMWINFWNILKVYTFTSNIICIYHLCLPNLGWKFHNQSKSETTASMAPPLWLFSIDLSFIYFQTFLHKWIVYFLHVVYYLFNILVQFYVSFPIVDILIEIGCCFPLISLVFYYLYIVLR